MLAVNYILKTQLESQASDISANSIHFSSLCHAEKRFYSFNVLSDMVEPLYFEISKGVLV